MSLQPAPALSLHLRLVLPVLCLASGYALDFINPLGLALGAAFSAWLLLGSEHVPLRLWWPITLAACAALASHKLPGFSPSQLWLPHQLSNDVSPYSLRLSWDKLLVGIALLAWWLGKPCPQQRQDNGQAILTATLTLLGVPLIALFSGLVHWQPKWPDGLWLWLLVNLLATVLAEEFIFRGLLQTQLVRWFGAGIGIGISTLLFAALHLPLNPLFALMAGLAGLGYGLVYHFSGRISLAVALHLAVNTLHLLLLSYPMRLPGL